MEYNNKIDSSLRLLGFEYKDRHIVTDDEDPMDFESYRKGNIKVYVCHVEKTVRLFTEEVHDLDVSFNELKVLDKILNKKDEIHNRYINASH